MAALLFYANGGSALHNSDLQSFQAEKFARDDATFATHDHYVPGLLDARRGRQHLLILNRSKLKDHPCLLHRSLLHCCLLVRDNGDCFLEDVPNLRSVLRVRKVSEMAKEGYAQGGEFRLGKLAQKDVAIHRRY